MPSIGGYTVLFVDGEMHVPGVKVKDVTRTGQYGTTYLETGYGGAPFEIRTTVDVQTAGAVSTLKASYASLKGLLVTVVDDLGNTYQNYMVLDVQVVSARRVTTMVGGINASPQYLVMASWTLQPAWVW